MLLLIGLAAALTSFGGALAVRRWAPALGLVDVPNDRSSHARPMPRGGGLPLVVTGLVGLLVLAAGAGMGPTTGILPLSIGAVLVAAVSLADDRWRLPVLYRLLAHATAAAVLVASGVVLREISVPAFERAIPLGLLAAPLTVVWIIGFTNAYNFMDGIDGLAAGQAVVSAITIGWLAYLQGHESGAMFMLLLASATAGFLLVNWPPATIFLGDVGSAFLGLAFAAWAIILSQPAGAPPFLAWIAVLSPFILDTFTTLIRRVARGDRWWSAHREHYYQRLIRSGWAHAPVTILYVAMAATCGAAVIAAVGYQLLPSAVVWALAGLQFGGVVLLVRRVEARAASGGS